VNIAFDAYSAFNSGGESGAYARNVIRCLTNHCKEENFVLYTYNKGKYPIQDFSGKAASLEVVRPESRFNKLFPGYYRSIGLGKFVSKYKTDVFHGISNFMPAQFPPEVKALRILSIQNTEKLRFSDENNFLRKCSHYLYAFRNISRAAHLILNSDADLEFIHEKFRIPQQRLHVIHPSLHPQFFSETNLQPDKSTAFHYLPKKFILCTAKLRNSIHAESLIHAAYLDRQNEDLPLLFAAKSHSGADSLKNLVRGLNIERKVFFVDGVSTGMMLFLYRRASALFYPARYESSALPLLEAMACNIPVLASKLPVFGQFCGNHIQYFDEESPEEILKWMNHLRENPQAFLTRSREAVAHAHTFSPAKFAEQLLQTYKDLK
jgi:glycosyltransferase involved in cell wall biosynthesis